MTPWPRRVKRALRFEDLDHALRAAHDIAGHDGAIVYGSTAIIGSHPDDDLPESLTTSVDFDIAFPDDPEAGIRIDGAAGEDSQFDLTNGFFLQGQSEMPATLPIGWRQRLVRITTSNGSVGHCLDPNDVALGKLAAHRPDKDLPWLEVAVEARAVDPVVMLGRMHELPDAVEPEIYALGLDWLMAHQ